MEISKMPDVRRESLLLVSGNFMYPSPNVDQLRTSIVDEELVPHPNLRDNIEQEWERKVKSGWKPNPMHLLHLKSFQLSETHRVGSTQHDLELVFSHTDGKNFVGSSDWQLWRGFGLDLDPQKIPQPLVTSSVILTKDRKLIIQERGASAHQSGNIDALGGHLDMREFPQGDIVPDEWRDKLLLGQSVDLLHSSRRELTEESGLTSEQMRYTRCLGLIYNYSDVSHYAMPFITETFLTSDELLKLKRSKEEKKQVNLLVVDLEGNPSQNPNHVTALIRNRLPNVDPEARLTIALARRYINENPMEAHQYGDQQTIIDTYNSLRKTDF